MSVFFLLFIAFFGRKACNANDHDSFYDTSYHSTFCNLSALEPTRTNGPLELLNVLRGRVEHFNDARAFCTFLRMYCIFEFSFG